MTFIRILRCLARESNQLQVVMAWIVFFKKITGFFSNIENDLEPSSSEQVHQSFNEKVMFLSAYLINNDKDSSGIVGMIDACTFLETLDRLNKDSRYSALLLEQSNFNRHGIRSSKFEGTDFYAKFVNAFIR